MDSKARDPTCQASLADRKYFNVSNRTFVKRTLVGMDYNVNGQAGGA
jgi:hypothetical protein